jgi:hypothetical protein
MGLLKSVDNVPGIQFYEYRDNEYYGKHKYRARFKLDGVHVLWYFKTVEKFRKQFIEGDGFYGTRKDLPTIRLNSDIFCDIITWRQKNSSEITVRIEGKTMAVFSNNLALLKSLENISTKLLVDYTEVQCSPFVGVKYFTSEPKHKYRVYLKSKLVESNFAQNLRNTVTRTKDLYPSNALKKWYNSQIRSQWKFRYSSASHFIDYDDESSLSYLALLHGDMLGKKYKLEKRPDTE